MPQYLIAIHRPNNYDPAASEDEAMHGEIDALNHEMMAAGVRTFVGSLSPISSAKSVSLNANRELTTTNEPYLKTSEHIGGLWVLNVNNEDEALDWANKAALACRASVEVRPFL